MAKKKGSTNNNNGKMSAQTARNKKLMIEALKTTMGIVSKACEIANVGRRTHYVWMDEDKSYREQVEDVTERAIDFAESKLLKRIDAEDTTSIIFYLKTKGKNRGYVEKQINDVNVTDFPAASLGIKIHKRDEE